MVDAWYGFQLACNFYPIEGHMLLYWGPINYALSYGLKLKFEHKPMGPSWEKHKFGDRLEDTLGNFTFTEMIDLFGNLSTRWSRAVDLYEKGLLDAEERQRKQQELSVAVVAGCCFRSMFNLYRWYVSRRGKKTAKLSAEEYKIVTDEIENLKKALPLVKTDRYFGFHEEAQWQMYDTERIKQKVSFLKKLVSQSI